MPKELDTFSAKFTRWKSTGTLWVNNETLRWKKLKQREGCGGRMGSFNIRFHASDNLSTFTGNSSETWKPTQTDCIWTVIEMHRNIYFKKRMHTRRGTLESSCKMQFVVGAKSTTSSPYSFLNLWKNTSFFTFHHTRIKRDSPVARCIALDVDFCCAFFSMRRAISTHFASQFLCATARTWDKKHSPSNDRSGVSPCWKVRLFLPSNSVKTPCKMWNVLNWGPTAKEAQSLFCHCSMASRFYFVCGCETTLSGEAILSNVVRAFCNTCRRICLEQKPFIWGQEGYNCNYRKIPHIRPPFDARKLMPKIGGGLICEDLTFCIKVNSRNKQVFQSIKLPKK